MGPHASISPVGPYTDPYTDRYVTCLYLTCSQGHNGTIKWLVDKAKSVYKAVYKSVRNPAFLEGESADQREGRAGKITAPSGVLTGTLTLTRTLTLT